MTKPTDAEIASEIATLKKMKPTVLRSSVFGDNHHAAIDAQVQVLSDRMDENESEDAFGDDSDNIRSAARDAAMWLAGEAENGAPSEGWKSLVR